jgi:hypothetical protein
MRGQPGPIPFQASLASRHLDALSLAQMLTDFRFWISPWSCSLVRWGSRIHRRFVWLQMFKLEHGAVRVTQGAVPGTFTGRLGGRRIPTARRLLHRPLARSSHIRRLVEFANKLAKQMLKVAGGMPDRCERAGHNAAS